MFLPRAQAENRRLSQSLPQSHIRRYDQQADHRLYAFLHHTRAGKMKKKMKLVAQGRIVDPRGPVLILSHCSGLCCSTILKSTCLTVSRLTEQCRKYLRLCYQMRGSVVFHYS